MDELDMIQERNEARQKQLEVESFDLHGEPKAEKPHKTPRETVVRAKKKGKR